jgi:hypothetical protein
VGGETAAQAPPEYRSKTPDPFDTSSPTAHASVLEEKAIFERAQSELTGGGMSAVHPAKATEAKRMKTGIKVVNATHLFQRYISCLFIFHPPQVWACHTIIIKKIRVVPSILRTQIPIYIRFINDKDEGTEGILPFQ